MRWGRSADRLHRAALLLAVSAVVLGGLGFAALTWWLLWLGFGARADPPNQVDLTKIALSVTAGVGGAVALVVAYRRQRDQERGRFAELFGAAARQLGDPDPAIRLAGVYAMAGVADEFSAPSRRQQCVDVLCGYLRLPYDPDSGANHLVSRSETVDEAGTKVERTYQHRQNDREVRSAVVRVLAQHLRRYSEVSWSGCDIDLTGAVFENVNFEAVEFGGRRTTFTGAKFLGDSDFRRVRFTGAHLTFRDAAFEGGEAKFVDAEFHAARTTFDGAKFSTAATSFADARFLGARTTFDGTAFSGAHASFQAAHFGGDLISFEHATFDGAHLRFDNAEFTGRRIVFAAARFFTATTDFGRTRFGTAGRIRSRGTHEIDFVAAELHGTVSFADAAFAGRAATFVGADFFGDISFLGTRFSSGATDFDRPKAWVGVRFDWDDNPSRKPVTVTPDPWPPTPAPTT